MELSPRVVRRSRRSGVHKTDLLSEEDETDSEVQMVDCLPPVARGSRLKNRKKKTNKQDDLVDRNMKLLDGISDLDGISEEERKQIVQALLNSKKEHSFCHDQQFNVEENKKGTSILLEENSHNTDGVSAEKQLVDTSKVHLWHKMPDKEEAMICEEERDDTTQVDSTPNLIEKSIPEVEVVDDEDTQPLQIMGDSKPEKENNSSPDSEENDCSFRQWSLDRIDSEADKVEPLHRRYRIVNGKVKSNPEFPLKMPDKLEYAKAILQMFEIYNRKLREAQMKCGNPLDWGETVKAGQHQANTIDVKRKGQAIMTMSDSEESSENFAIDTNQKHSIMVLETQDFKTNDRMAPASSRKNMSKSGTNSPDIFEDNRFDLVEDEFLNTKTEESQLFRMETPKLTDIVELNQKHLGSDIHEDDLNVVAKKSDMDLFDAQKINNDGRRRKREIEVAEDLDDFEPKKRVTRRQKFTIPAVKEITNFEIHQNEKMAWKKGMLKTGFGKSKTMEAGNGFSAPDDTKCTKMCIDRDNLQVVSLENDQATTKQDLFEEMDNLNASGVSEQKGNLISDVSIYSQIETTKFFDRNEEENMLLVEDTQDLHVFDPCMENRTQDAEGIDITVVQDSQPQNEDEWSPNLQDSAKAKHRTVQKMKKAGAELMCKMKKFFTTVLEKEEVSQDDQKGSQSPVYKKRKLLPRNMCMLNVESVAKPGVQRLMNRPVSHESNSTDPCSQGSSTLLNPVGELYSTQISIIKEKKTRNALTLNHKKTSTKSSTVFELSDSEDDDIVKQIGQGKFPQRERSQEGVSMPVKSKGSGHSQDKKSEIAENGTLTKAKKTGLDRLFNFTSNPITETLETNKKEKRKDESKGEQHCNRNQEQFQEKRMRTNTVTTKEEIEIFTNKALMDGTKDLPQYFEEDSCNIKPGKSKSKPVDFSEKKVSSENCKESDAVSNINVSSEPSHATASMTAAFERIGEGLEVDQRNRNGIDCKVNIKTLPSSTLTGIENVLSVENRTLQNKDLIQAGTSTTGQGRKVCMNRKVVHSDRKTYNDVFEKSTDEYKKRVNKEFVMCPICGKDFLARQIVDHAATCMDEEQNEGLQQGHKGSETRARAHTPELEKDDSSLMEMCYICDGHFFKGQIYQDHLEGCLEQAKRHQQEVEMKGFKTVCKPVVEKNEATSRNTRSRARGHVGAGDKGLLDGRSEAMDKYEGYNNTVAGSDLNSDTDDTSTSKAESDQEGSSHLTPPDWIKDLSRSPIRTFIPISQQQESEYFRNQFAYRLDKVEKAMAKRKRKVSRKKRTSRKRRRTSKSVKNPNKCI